VAVEENASALPRSFGYVVWKEIAYPANMLGDAILSVLYSLLCCFHFIELPCCAPGRIGIRSEAMDEDEAVPKISRVNNIPRKGHAYSTPSPLTDEAKPSA
jgi:hypothetical protein